MIPSWLARLTQQGKTLLPGQRPNRAAVAGARELYQRAVAQSRQPMLFTTYGVPDTHDGRLEAIQLHVILLLRRLQRGPAPSQAMGQALFDVMFQDIDNSLREGGVGDLVVGKWIKKIARQFYARAAAVEAALEVRDRATLTEVLGANVYGGEVAAERVAGLIDYLLAMDTQLGRAAAASDDPIEALHFPPPDAIDFALHPLTSSAPG